MTLTVAKNDTPVDTRTDGEKDPPAGWTQAAWDALCGSEATRQANDIYTRGSKLLDCLNDFLNEFPHDPDLTVLRAAGVPFPSKNLEHLLFCKIHIAGLVWPLEMALDAIADVLPPRLNDAKSGRNAA